MWQNVEIAGSVGRSGQNDPADVVKITDALRTVQARPELGRECDLEALCGAISDIQRAFGLHGDGRIDPGGGTLERLNTLGSGPTLVRIELAALGKNSGGYRVVFDGKVPVKSYALHLVVPPVSTSTLPENAIPVNGKGGLDRRGLERLLQSFAELGAWGTTADGCLFLARDDGAVVTQSSPCPVTCPIKPYEGRLLPNVAELDPPMDYTIKTQAAFFNLPPIGERYYFVYGGLFITDQKMRGFDCTTYAGSVLGVDARTGAMGGDGGTLADHLEAEKVGLESVSEVAIRSYFAANSQGVYIAWTAGHVILIVNAVAHEFNIAPRKGYLKRPVAPAQSSADQNQNELRFFPGTWTVRRVPGHKVPAGWT